MSFLNSRRNHHTGIANIAYVLFYFPTNIMKLQHTKSYGRSYTPLVHNFIIAFAFKERYGSRAKQIAYQTNFINQPVTWMQEYYLITNSIRFVPDLRMTKICYHLYYPFLFVTIALSQRLFVKESYRKYITIRFNGMLNGFKKNTDFTFTLNDTML